MGKLLVGRLFFIKGLLQQLGGFGMAHGPGPRDEGSVGRHFVVLRALSSGDWPTGPQPHTATVSPGLIWQLSAAM
jgi:hypothetical protein